MNTTDKAARNAAVLETDLIAIRELWKKLYPEAMPFRGSYIDELEHYSHTAKMDLTNYLELRSFHSARKARAELHLVLYSKIVQVLLRQCRVAS